MSVEHEPSNAHVTTDDATDPFGVLGELINGGMKAQIVRVFAQLNLADHLANGPHDLAWLAALTSTPPAVLARLLRAAAALGLCTMSDDDQIHLAAIGQGLRADAPQSSRSWALLLGSPWMSAAWQELASAVRSGTSTFVTVHGVGFWEYVAAHPDEGAFFDSAMTSGAGPRGCAVAERIDMADVASIVDVGGGQGLLLASVLSKVPNVHGIVADRPKVISDRSSGMNDEDVENRLEFRPADFFDSVPSGADLYLLSRILHDWPDLKAIEILRTCRRAMPDDGRLCIIESIVPPIDSMSQADQLDHAIRDLNMLVLVGGQERTANEYTSLLHRAGFTVVAIHTCDSCDLIEARPTTAAAQ